MNVRKEGNKQKQMWDLPVVDQIEFYFNYIGDLFIFPIFKLLLVFFHKINISVKNHLKQKKNTNQKKKEQVITF